MANVGVKYCGGCNPRFDRTGLLESIKAQVRDLQFDWVNEEEVYDFLLVICGCERACVDLTPYRVTGKTAVLTSDNNIEVEEIFWTGETATQKRL